MELISVELNGYKRLEGPTKANVDERIIALVGPNEAGKSSLLDALMHLESQEPFSKQELTRGVEVGHSQVIVRARFWLSESDRKALSHWPNSSNVTYFDWFKANNGKPLYQIEQNLHRDIGYRKHVVRTLSAMMSDQNSLSAVSQKNLNDLRIALDVENESLNKDVLNNIKVLVDQVDPKTTVIFKGSPTSFKDVLTKLYEDETCIHPNDDAARILAKRKPRFLLYSDQDRSLGHVYDLTAEAIRPALRNLAHLAELNLDSLCAAVKEKDQAQIATIQDRANAVLAHKFLKAWSQSDISVRVRVNENTLHVLVQNEARSTSIAERSDGLRQFVALVAFVNANARASQKPILLIDEAETHLHYDAQADLVQMMAKQELVSKIIYTTHSVGCLPEDLGTGVRLLRPIGDERSKVENWFWESDLKGFTPLLFGMGAATLAFVPVRNALVAEGPTDFILLPSLLREATNRSYLGFQVVPGLSTANGEQLALLRNTGKQVAFLVDGDRGGEKIRAKLIRAGVPNEDIISLPSPGHEELVLEDFIDPDVYYNAINECLTHWDKKPDTISRQDENRPGHVANWCKARGLNHPSKREVAYRVLEEKRIRGIVYEKRRESLISLYSEIIKILKIE